MAIQIQSPQDLGAFIRQVRRQSGTRQDDLAAMIGVSHVTLGQIERGHVGAAIGTVLAALAELGIRVHLDIPPQEASKAAGAPNPRKPPTVLP